MGHLCQQGTGLFPTPKEIEFSCSCPDGAYMCKHVAAVLYGVGARLDHQPELLFRLRNVHEQDLIASAAADAPLSKKAPAAGKVLDTSDVAGVFGVEFAPAAPVPASTRKAVAAPPPPKRAPATGKKATKAAGKAKATKATKATKKTRLGAARRKAISERMRRYWEERRRG